MGQTFGGQILYDPFNVRDARKRFRRNAAPELALANSLAVVSGLWPTRGWLLMCLRDYNKIDKYSTSLQLQIDDFQSGTLTIKNLAIIQARCVSTGLASDEDALYLVEITDAQGVIWNPWFDFGTTSQYNVAAPAYPGRYYSPSTNGASAWTWSQMIGDLWGQMSNHRDGSQALGPFPGLPFVPSGVPEGFVFPGGSAWEALCIILDLLGMTVACDMTLDQPYTIVYSGNPDAAFTAKQTLYTAQNRLEDDALWIDVGSGRVPGLVVVYFHVQYQYYGSEETIRRDTLQWTSNQVYSVPVNAPAQFSSARGTAYIWDDFVVKLDVDGNPLAADVATANAFAQDRVNEFFAKIYSGTSGFMSQTYCGALPFSTGSQCDGVRWRQTRDEFGRVGWKTDLVRGHIWNDVVFSREPETIVGTREDA